MRVIALPDVELRENALAQVGPSSALVLKILIAVLMAQGQVVFLAARKTVGQSGERTIFLMLRYVLDLVAIVEVGCWGVCFWWMHRISSRQNAMLEQLKLQGDRIEGVSREEHKILQDLHPTVQKIEKNLDESDRV